MLARIIGRFRDSRPMVWQTSASLLIRAAGPTPGIGCFGCDVTPPGFTQLFPGDGFRGIIPRTWGVPLAFGFPSFLPHVWSYGYWRGQTMSEYN